MFWKVIHDMELVQLGQSTMSVQDGNDTLCFMVT
jgi:hypothetical protein